jgi:hypothetical protein
MRLHLGSQGRGSMGMIIFFKASPAELLNEALYLAVKSPGYLKTKSLAFGEHHGI